MHIDMYMIKIRSLLRYIYIYIYIYIYNDLPIIYCVDTLDNINLCGS